MRVRVENVGGEEKGGMGRSEPIPTSRKKEGGFEDGGMILLNTKIRGD